MSARDQSKPSANASLDEAYQERGLRILGKIIARELINKRRQIGVEAGSEGMSAHKVSEEKRENLPGN